MEHKMNFTAIGEILFDSFKDTQILGGAPLNVAGHLSRMGAHSSIISAVGSDALGKRALEEIQEIKVDTSHISVVAKETGVALIELENGIPTYDFNTDNAFDNIPLRPYDISNCDIFYFGSLSQRTAHNVAVVKSILDQPSTAIKFFDVNIRKKYYSPDFIRYGLAKCHILKMNDEEIPIIGEIIGSKDKENEVLVVKQLMDEYQINLILITKGKNGTTLYQDGVVLNQGIKKVPVVDTVGAGDSFSAAFLYFYFHKESLATALKKGSALADYVVGKAGAIPSYDQSIIKELGL